MINQKVDFVDLGVAITAFDELRSAKTSLPFYARFSLLRREAMADNIRFANCLYFLKKTKTFLCYKYCIEICK